MIAGSWLGLLLAAGLCAALVAGLVGREAVAAAWVRLTSRRHTDGATVRLRRVGLSGPSYRVRAAPERVELRARAGWLDVLLAVLMFGAAWWTFGEPVTRPLRGLPPAAIEGEILLAGAVYLGLGGWSLLVSAQRGVDLTLEVGRPLRLVERRGLLPARERELPADLVVGVAVDEAPSVSLALETGQRLALFPRSRFRAGAEAQRQDMALVTATLRALAGLPPA